MLGTLTALAANPTVWLVAAALFLGWELYRRVYLTFDDDCKTVIFVPFVNWPKISRIKEGAKVELEMLEKNGQLVRMVNLWRPSERIILASDPDLLREVFVGSRWQDFQRQHEEWHRYATIFAGGLILIPNGDRWKEARDLFGRTFTDVYIRNSYQPLMKGFLDKFVKEVEAAAASGEPFNLQPYFTRFTFGFIVRVIFGEDLDRTPGGEFDRCVEAWDAILENASILTLIDKLFGSTVGEWSGIRAKIENGKEVLHALVKRNIERRKRGEDLERASIFDDAMSAGSVPGWMLENDNAELVKHLMTLLFGGHDTTASMLSFLAGELATHQKWQDEIRKEVLEEFGPDGEMSLDKLATLKVLNAAIKETLRLYPAAVNGAQRVIPEDMDFQWKDSATGQIKTIKFKKNDFMLPSLFGTQRHPANWTGSDPSSFDPSRFLESPTGGAKAFHSFSPFGHGQRKCMGEKLAFAEGRLVTAELLRRWRLVPAPGWELGFNQASMLVPNGIKVKLVPVKA
ncbi:cytochrome P450 [Hyaloraphidium curvatum]|nr:cytochrome P450 [Hyaloraphidium curvatum]